MNKILEFKQKVKERIEKRIAEIELQKLKEFKEAERTVRQSKDISE